MSDNVIKLWQGDVTAQESDYPRYWLRLGQAEQKQSANFQNKQIRQRFVEIHGRLREILGDVVNEDPAELRIHRAQYGKPYLADYPGLSFNLSHTGNKMAVAVAHHCELGVDIEHCKPRPNLAALVEKCFAEEEMDFWRQLPDTQKTQAFYRFWTRKEAFVKATGRGIALGLKHCVINPNRLNEFLRVPEEYGPPAAWRIHDIAINSSIDGALAVNTGKPLTIEIIQARAAAEN